MDDNTQLNAQNKLNKLKEKLETLEKYSVNGDSKQIKKHNQNINYCRQEIANLEAFLSFAVGQKVTNGEKVGEISALTLSPGGMPEVWVSWAIGSAPIPEQPARLQIVETSTESELITDSSDNQLELLATDNNDDNIILSEIPTPNSPSETQQSESEQSLINKNNIIVNSESEPLKEEPSNKQLESEESSITAHSKVKDEFQQVTTNEPLINPLINDNNEPNIVIDEELKALIPALSQNEKEQLEANLLTEGIRDPLVVWKHYHMLLDGHNRYEIAIKHNLPFITVEVELPDKNAARLWLINNQLGRRNLSPEQISFLRGQRYNLEKQQGKRTDLTSFQNVHEDELETSRQNDEKLNQEQNVSSVTSRQSDEKLSEKLAKQYKVASRTIERDAEFAVALSEIASVLGEQIKQDILARQLRLTKKAVFELAQAASSNPDSAQELLESLKSGHKPEIAKHLKLTPGCLVQVNSPDNRDLHERVVRVGSVSAKRVQIWHRKIDTTMEMVKYNLDLDQVEFVPMSDKPHVKELNDRLEKLRQCNLDPFERDFLTLFDRCVALTPAEEDYLSFVERRYLS